MKASRPRNASGFTLIEIMVVVGILVLLVAILVPAVGSARSSSRKAATNSQLRGIALACESYYQVFRAYPGALSEDTYTGTTSVPFTSSQALVVALTRAFYTAAPNPAPPGGAQQIGALPFYVALNPAVSPRDYSENPPNGRNYDAFINPSPAQLSSSIGLLAGNTDIPTFVDSAYGTDALPILYYRPARKYDPSVTNTGGTAMTTVGKDSSSFVAFYSDTNEYLATLTGSSGSKAFANSSIGNLNTNTPQNKTGMDNLLFQNVGGNAVARGGFVLISAGADRTYGQDPKLNIDDIIVAGGN